MTNQPGSTSLSNKQSAKLKDPRDPEIHHGAIDFIARIPYDVLCSLAFFLGKEPLCECIQVSSVWRERILNCPAFWTSVQLKDAYEGLMLSLLPLVAEHVRDIEICTPAKSLTKLFEIVKSGVFTDLQSLSVAMPYSERAELLRGFKTEEGRRVTGPVSIPSLAVYSQICNVLPDIAATLTKLKLSLSGYHDAPALTEILFICQRLTDVEYHCESFQASKEIPIEHTTVLTRVVLSTDTDYEISESVLETLLMNSPHIQSLTLHPCKYFDVLSIIDRYPNKLMFLSINANMLMVAPSDPDDYACEGEYQGLLCLVLIHGRRWTYPLLEYLSKHRHSIQTLYLSAINRYIYGTFKEDSEGIITSPYAIPPKFPVMENLTTLSIQSMNGSDYWNATPDILPCAPKLNTLEIADRNMYRVIPDNVVDLAAAEMKSITRLKLQSVPLYVPAKLRLLGHLATCTLVELQLNSCSMGDKEVAYMAVARIKSLKKLWLRSTLVNQPQKSTKRYMRELGKLPQLEYIYIGTWDRRSKEYINDEDLYNLCECMSLKTIDLENIKGYTKDATAMVRSRDPPIQLRIIA